MNTKICKDCKIEKPISEFRKHKKGSKYYRSYCKVCCNSRANQWNKNNRDKISKRQKVYRQENPEACKLRDRKSLLKKYGITLNDYIEMIKKLLS